jgi:hypothetical protein
MKGHISLVLDLSPDSKIVRTQVSPDSKVGRQPVESIGPTVVSLGHLNISSFVHEGRRTHSWYSLGKGPWRARLRHFTHLTAPNDLKTTL